MLTVRDRSAREVRDPMKLKSDAQRKLLRCKSVIKLKEKRAHEGGAGWAGPRPGQDGPHQKKKKVEICTYENPNGHVATCVRACNSVGTQRNTTNTICHIWYDAYIHSCDLNEEANEAASQPEPTRWRGSNFPAPKWGLSLLPSRTHHRISCILRGFANWLSLLLKCKQTNQSNKKSPTCWFSFFANLLVRTNLCVCGDPGWLLFS